MNINHRRWISEIISVLLFVVMSMSINNAAQADTKPGIKPGLPTNAGHIGLNTSPVTNAHDGDTRHCVTPREIFLFDVELTRHVIEYLWEMKDRGHWRGDIPFAGRGWVYKMCDGNPHCAVIFYLVPGVLVVGKLGIAGKSCHQYLSS